MKNAKLLVLLLLAVCISPAYSHFQVIYTPESMTEEEARNVDFKLVFTHPFNAGHTMDIGKNEAGEIKGMQEFFSVHKGVRTDALGGLKETVFTSLENSGVAYDFTLDKEYGFRGSGDWILMAIPHPYYEGAEDIYIQQATKVMINKSGIATDWSSRCAPGYPEIMPLVKPYDVWKGGVFSGIVIDGAGDPVPFAEIEVEFMNYDLDMAGNKFTGEKKIHKESHGAAVILANAQGGFDFIPPKAGYWGFASLGAGGDLSFDGKELSQDAVLWIQVNDIDEGAVSVPLETAGPAAPVAVEKESGNNLAVIIGILALVLVVFVVFNKKKNKKGDA